MRSITVLLTATINPGATRLVARNDPELRLADYESALRSWISVEPAVRVVFCENSGHDLATLLRLITRQSSDRLEILGFSGNTGGHLKGKGFAELGTIAHAMVASRLLSGADLIVKCSGRIFIRNAPRFLRSVAACEGDVICTLKRFLSFADSRVFCATPAFIREHLQPRQDFMDDARGVYFEHMLASAVTDAVAHGKRWRPFPVLPRIQGISGTNGTSMTDSAPVAAARALYNNFRNAVYRR